MLFLGPDKRRGAGGGEGIEGEKRDISVIDTPDVEVVVAGGEGGTDEERVEAEDNGEVAVRCAVGFKSCSRAFFAREKNELIHSLIALAPAVLASSELVEDTRNRLGGTTASAGMPVLSLSLFFHSASVSPSPCSRLVPPRAQGRHSSQRLDAPVLHVLRGRERDDRQTTLREAYELLVREVRNGDRKLQVGPHRHARDGREVVRCREFLHARRGQLRVLVGCAFRLVVVARGRWSLLTPL